MRAYDANKKIQKCTQVLDFNPWYENVISQRENWLHYVGYNILWNSYNATDEQISASYSAIFISQSFIAHNVYYSYSLVLWI